MIKYVATINTEKGIAKLGIEERDERFWVIGLLPDGTIEETEQNDESFGMAVESIGMMYSYDVWELEWLDNIEVIL